MSRLSCEGDFGQGAFGVASTGRVRFLFNELDGRDASEAGKKRRM
jgi:hypothetical protein